MTTWTVPAVVVKVIDGDTIRLALDLGWHIGLTTNVRIDGVDAPELSTDAGKAARTYVATLLPFGQEVMFRSRSLDKYGRPLGALWVEGLFSDLASLLISSGHGVEYHGGPRGM